MNVTVYSTTNCGMCHAEMQWLTKNDIDFTKKVVDEDEALMEEFMTVNEGSIGTPFTIVEDNGQLTKIVGFDQKKLKEVLLSS